MPTSNEIKEYAFTKALEANIKRCKVIAWCKEMGNISTESSAQS